MRTCAVCFRGLPLSTSLEVFFPLREDVPQLLGNYKKEAVIIRMQTHGFSTRHVYVLQARFGDKEQVEAASEKAKSVRFQALRCSM